MNIDSLLEKTEAIYVHATKQLSDKEAVKAIKHLGFDQPKILNAYDIEKLKELFDKWLRFNEIATGGK